jgi:2-polyprenyl-3-methyl-5-hydroxy-6-metoxy-1,4-benzoquinol methylase
MSGIEVRKKCLKYIKNDLKNVKAYSDLKNTYKKFDLITLFHVLEHIPYQIETLKNIRSKLKKKMVRLLLRFLMPMIFY